MKIYIAKRDIHGAEINSFENCPIARCLRRKFPRNEFSVSDTELCVNGHYYTHTPESKAYALAWNGGEATPGSLIIPDIGACLLREAA